MSEPVPEQIATEIEELVEETKAYVPPFFKNAYFSTDHFRDMRKAERLFKKLKDNEILQVTGYYNDRFPAVKEVAESFGISLTQYYPKDGDPYYWIRNGYVCKRIPIASLEKYKDMSFDPANLIE